MNWSFWNSYEVAQVVAHSSSWSFCNFCFYFIYLLKYCLLMKKKITQTENNIFLCGKWELVLVDFAIINILFNLVIDMMFVKCLDKNKTLNHWSIGWTISMNHWAKERKQNLWTLCYIWFSKSDSCRVNQDYRMILTTSVRLKIDVIELAGDFPLLFCFGSI